jgi:dTDP-4-amino-4,6-dideoxygalactose transaminase
VHGSRSKPAADGVQEEWRVPLADVEVDDEILQAVRNAVASGWWSMGPRVEEFEARFAAFCGARHAIALSSGTAALHLALVAAGCGPGDEVIVPSLNFVAAANMIAQTGARPVFCDVAGPLDLNLDPADVEAAVGPATRAILVLHYGGYPCDIDAVLDIARRHDLMVIEDAAHAPGASSGGRMCGTIGLAGCFSFFSNKNLPVGEGGMLVTDDDEFADRVRLLRSHGMTTLTWARHRGHAHSYDVVAQGLNYRLDEVRAAIGLVQLRRLVDANRERARIAARYRRELDGVNGLTIPFRDRDGAASSAHHLAVLVLPDDGLQAPMRDLLGRRRIQTSIHYPPIHRFSAYADPSNRALPNTDRVGDRILTLPLYAHMRDDQVSQVVEGVLDALGQAGGAVET